MWRQHLDKLAGAALLLITAMLLAWQLGDIKTGVRIDWWDCLGEITTLVVATGWLCLIVSSRPRGPVTNWLFSGSFLLVFSYSLDLLDEVVSYPDNIRLMSWLESFPAPVGMLLLTFGLIGWHREQLAINRQLQGRELFLRDHQLIDPLTQLYGPVYLQAVLKRELNVHQQTQQPLSLLMLDLAGFSQYNKGHGIAAGDTFLMQFSELLTHQLRQQDLICRFAGDCFVAVLPQTTAATATVLNQHIAQQLQQLLPEPQIQFAAITLTLGELGEHNEQTEQWPDADTLLRRASKMLLAAKKSGQYHQSSFIQPMSNTPFGYQDKILLTRPQVTDLLQLAARRGVPPDKLLSGTTIFQSDLHKPQHRIHSSAWLKFMQQCQQLQSPELPFLTASALLQNTDIPLCNLLQHAGNLQQALKYLLYFRHQLAPYLFVRLQQQPGHISIELLPAIGLGAQQQFVCEIWLSLILQLIKQQLGSTVGCKVYLRWPAPKTAGAYQALWPAEVFYQQTGTAIQIDKSCWLQEFKSAEPAQFNRALQNCRQQNLLLAKQPGILEFAWRKLSKSLPVLLTQEQLAQEFGISVSALKRLLQQHHSSYSQLLDEVRNQLALSLLNQQDLSNRQLAQRLGYSDEHNFRRAFKRWTGAIPSAFRLL